MPPEPPKLSADDRARLSHMLEAARLAVRFCDGASEDDLGRDDMLRLAVVKALETIGEASTKISDATRDGVPTIDWWAIRRMRNRLIHGYNSIDTAIVWRTVGSALPILIAELERLLAGNAGRP